MIAIESKGIPEQVRTDVVARIVSVRQATKGSRQPLAALERVLATASEHGAREMGRRRRLRAPTQPIARS